jgi:hypothetical protein
MRFGRYTRNRRKKIESCERAIQRLAVNSFLYLQGIHETSATRLANVPEDLQPEE